MYCALPIANLSLASGIARTLSSHQTSWVQSFKIVKIKRKPQSLSQCCELLMLIAVAQCDSSCSNQKDRQLHTANIAPPPDNRHCVYQRDHLNIKATTLAPTLTTNTHYQHLKNASQSPHNAECRPDPRIPRLPSSSFPFEDASRSPRPPELDAPCLWRLGLLR